MFISAEAEIPTSSQKATNFSLVPLSMRTFNVAVSAIITTSCDHIAYIIAIDRCLFCFWLLDNAQDVLAARASVSVVALAGYGHQSGHVGRIWGYVNSTCSHILPVRPLFYPNRASVTTRATVQLCDFVTARSSICLLLEYHEQVKNSAMSAQTAGMRKETERV